MTRYKTENFFVLYDYGLRRKRLSCRSLQKELEKRGTTISARALQRYKSREMIPDFRIAEAIFDVLELEASKQEIQESLDYAREMREYNYESTKYLERGIRLRISKLSNRISDDAQIQMALSKRMAETQGVEKGNLNKYITMLIQYDIDNKVLPTKRRKSGDDE